MPHAPEVGCTALNLKANPNIADPRYTGLFAYGDLEFAASMYHMKQLTLMVGLDITAIKSIRKEITIRK
jgi:hypothetical protein